MRHLIENQFYDRFDLETMTPREPDDYRTPFQIDRDRIIYSSAFRRLQAKTQVFLADLATRREAYHGLPGNRRLLRVFLLSP